MTTDREGKKYTMSSDDPPGGPTPRRRRGRPPRYPLPEPEDRAAAILDAALGAFAQKGYADTGMHDIARRCRMTKPTVYEYFRSKAELFDAVVERERSALLAMLRETYIQSAEYGLWEKVRTDTAAFVHWVCDNPEAFALLYLIPSPQIGVTQRLEMQNEVAAALVISMEKQLVKHGRSGGASLTVLAHMAISGSLGAVLASAHLLPEHADEVIDLAAGFVTAAFRNVPTEALTTFDWREAAES